MIDFAVQTLSLYLEAAPWLLFGLMAAGVIKAGIPESLMQRWLGGSGVWPVAKAALVGAPLPLCSCGVLPAALGLRRAGASRGSTVSFLVATPETGIDSIALTYALLGPFMAVVRPVSALLSAVVAGLLTAAVPEEERITARPQPPTPCTARCTSCPGDVSSPPTAWRRLLAGMRYSITDVLDDIAPWLAVGLLLAGAVATWLPPMVLTEWGSGPGAMLIMLLAGIPMYICATASTPFAAALLIAGVSPGTVLVFLLAGPATNLGTLAVVHRELGARVLVAYLVGIAVAAITLGLTTDWLAGRLHIDIPAQVTGTGEIIPDWIAAASAVLLLILSVRPLRRHLFGRRFIPIR